MSPNDHNWIFVEVKDGQIMFGCGDTWPAASPPSKLWYTTEDTRLLTLSEMKAEIQAVIDVSERTSSLD